MTEYGRGQARASGAPEEDPLYGEPGWDPYAPQGTGYQQTYQPDGAAYGGQYADPYGQSYGYDPYGQQQYPQHHPEQQYAEQQYAALRDGTAAVL